MTKPELLAELRDEIGNPDQEVISDRVLTRWLEKGMHWLAGELPFNLTTEEQVLALVADQQTYPVPKGLQRIQWLEYGTSKLTAATTDQWDDEGTAWRDAESGTPTSYAREARELIFNCPVDADSIADYPFARIRGTWTPTLDLAGVERLADSDARCVVLYAAWRFCEANPTDDNRRRAQSLATVTQNALDKAKQRLHQPVEDLQPPMRVHVERNGAYR